MQDLNEVQARQRGPVRWFDDDRTTRRDRRRNLVCDQVQRMVKRANRNHHADGLLAGEGNSILRRFANAHGDHFSRTASKLINTDVDRVDSAIDFNQRIDQRFATLAGRFDGQFFPPLAHDGHGAGQDLDTFAHRQPRVPIPVQSVGVGERLLDHGTVCALNARDGAKIPRRDDGHRTCSGARTGNQKGNRRDCGIHWASRPQSMIERKSTPPVWFCPLRSAQTPHSAMLSTDFHLGI